MGPISDADDEIGCRVSRHRSTSCSSGGATTPLRDTLGRRQHQGHQHSDATRSKGPGAPSHPSERVSDSSGNDEPLKGASGHRRRTGPKEELLLHTDLLYYVPTYPQWTAIPEPDSEDIVMTTSSVGVEEVPGRVLILSLAITRVTDLLC